MADSTPLPAGLSTDDVRDLRSDHAGRTRARIIKAAVAEVLDGREPAMRSVAARARIGERTIYRYFPSLQDLHDALAEEVGPRMGVPLCERFDDLPNYARSLYTVFHDNNALMVAALSAPWALKYLNSSRARNLAGMQALVDERFPDAPPHERRSVALTLRTLLSGSGWVYQHESCGATLDEAIEAARMTIEALSDRLEIHPSER